MPIELDTAEPERYERQPGDFRRRGKDGPPLVKSLTKTRKRKGNKPDLIAMCEAEGIDVPDKATVAQLHELLGPEAAWETYKRPSNYGALIDDETNLIKWKERQVALGIAMNPRILEHMRDANDENEKALLDRVCRDAHDEAQSMLAAERGTYVHLLTEWAEEALK